MLDEYFDELEKYEPIDKDAEKELMIKAKKGDLVAYNKVINSNLRFVVSIAKTYQGQGIPLEDLIAEGNIGLIKAYNKFDINRNVKFISYAVWWIRQSILKSIHDNAKTIRIPFNKISSVVKIDRAKVHLSEELGRLPSTEELREYVGDIVDDEQYCYTMLDLDKPQTENEKDLEEVIPAEEDYDLSEDFLIDLEKAIEGFADREKIIIKMYYGIGYDRCFTLEDIGKKLKLTKERIRQIKKRSIKRLQLHHRSEPLRSYL